MNNKTHKASILLILLFLMIVKPVFGQDESQNELDSSYEWTVSERLINSDNLIEEDWITIKDPSIVHYNGKYHVFFTVRGHERSHGSAYTSFENFEDLSPEDVVMLPHHDGYIAAPQVFYFTPHEKWYMVAQTKKSSWNPEYQAAYATTTDISDPNSWSEMKPMNFQIPEEDMYLDFWVIADEEKIYLFFTSDNGNMWREETTYEEFPYGWSEPVLAQQADIFEASHIYKVKNTDLYINVIEARLTEDRRYFKAYTATELDGEWEPLAADCANAFASMTNVTFEGEHWTNGISHGELVRAGIDEKMEVNGDNYTFIFQGVLHQVRKGMDYGKIPWDIGILREIEE
jgi:hypothetical protein